MADLKAPTLEVKKASKKEDTRKRHTIRLEVKLFEPTKDSFPRYNVRLLKEKFLKEHFGTESDTKTSTLLTLDESASASGPSFSDHENDDVARMAKKFEEKYGNGTAYEMSDKGAGYDENDSFIDNTEAFDETLVNDTPCGGFYINSGPLKFTEKKEVGNASSGNGSNGTKSDKNPGTKKRSIGSLSSFESDVGDETGEKPKKPKKIKLKKQKRKETIEPQKPCKEIAIKDMLRFQRDNLLKTKTDSPKHHRNRIVSDDEESDADSIALSETSNDSDVKFIDNPTLSCPTGLPDDIAKKIEEFISVSEGKTGDQILTNAQLLQILTEIEGSKIMSLDQKIAIRTYLTSNIPCQDLYRKVQKERPWEQKQVTPSPMDTGTGTGFEPQEKQNPVAGQPLFATITRLPSID